MFNWSVPYMCTIQNQIAIIFLHAVFIYCYLFFKVVDLEFYIFLIHKNRNKSSNMLLPNILSLYCITILLITERYLTLTKI